MSLNRSAMIGEIDYRNADLVLTSADDLQTLADAMEQRGAFVLYADAEDDGTWTARCEAGGELCVCGPGRDYTPDRHIGWLLDIVESLPDELREVWSRCASRVFDLGFECGDRPFGFEQTVSADVLLRIVSHRGSLAITIYPSAPPKSEVVGPVWRRYPPRRRR